MTEPSAPKPQEPKRRPSTFKRMLLMLLFVVLLAAGLGFGFFLHIKALIASAPKPVPATVTDTRVAASSWQPTLKAVGTLSAVHGVDLATQVAGVVASLPVESGAKVAAGTVLMQLDAAPDRAQLDSLKAAAMLARTTLARDRKLLTGQTVTQATIDAGEADLKSKTALVARQEALIAEKSVTAPFAGQLGIVEVNLGQYVTPGTPVVTLQDLSAMRDDFVVPQDEIAKLAPGQAVTVTVDTYPGRVFTGKITAISPKIDLDTRNVTVRAVIPNPDGLLRPGMFVRTEVKSGAPRELLTLPATAIAYNSYGTSVYVIVPAKTGKGEVVRQVFVTTGPTRGDQVAVLKGLTAGERVVTSGQLKLGPGAAVVVDNAVTPPDQPDPKPPEQ